MADGTNRVRLTVHGLDVDNGFVRAEVFAEKLRHFANAVKSADSGRNRSQKFSLIIRELKIGSADAWMDAKQIKRAQKVPASPIPDVSGIASAIQGGSTSFDGVQPKLIGSLAAVASGAGRTHSHVEVDFGDGAIVRFDQFFEGRAERAKEIAEGVEAEAPHWFEGASIGQFDGTIRQVDSRGAIVRGKIVLTIDGSELDCTFRRADLDSVIGNYEHRSKIEGIAVYDGLSERPVRVDVRKVTPVLEGANILRWGGYLKRPTGPMWSEAI